MVLVLFCDLLHYINSPLPEHKCPSEDFGKRSTRVSFLTHQTNHSGKGNRFVINFDKRKSSIIFLKFCYFLEKKNWKKKFRLKTRASQGGYMFPCSLEKIGVFPLFPKNKLRCSLKFTFIKFPCSQKFCCMFPWSPETLPETLPRHSQESFLAQRYSQDHSGQNYCLGHADFKTLN